MDPSAQSQQQFPSAGQPIMVQMAAFPGSGAPQGLVMGSMTPQQFADSVPAAVGIPTHAAGRPITGASQGLFMGSTTPQVFAGSIPAAVGIPTHAIGRPITGASQGLFMGFMSSQGFAGSTPASLGIPTYAVGQQISGASHAQPGVGIPGQGLLFSGAHPPLQTMDMGAAPPHLQGPGPPAFAGAQPAPLLPPKQPAGFLENCLNAIRCCNALEECYYLNEGCCSGDCGEWC